MPVRPLNVDCSELSATIAQIALHYGQAGGSVDDVVKQVQGHFPTLERDEIVDSIVQYTKSKPRKQNDIQKNLAEIKKEARLDRATRERIDRLERELAGLPVEAKTAKQRKDVSDAIKNLRAVENALKGDKRYIDRVKALREKIADLRDQVRTSNIRMPEAKSETKMTEELQRLMFEQARAKAALNQKVNDLRPVTFREVLTAPGHFAKMVMTTSDLSYIGRQGAVALLSGRWKEARNAFMAQFRAMKSDAALAAHAQSIMDRPNGPLYKKAGLEIADHMEELEGRSVEVMKRMMNNDNPVLKAIGKGAAKFEKAMDYTPIPYADRAFAAAGNQMRADLFDTMYESLGGNVTEAEAKHIADMVNDMTLRATMQPNVAKFLNNFLFSARALKARINLLTLAPLRNAPSMRSAKLAAKQYLRFLIGATVLYATAKLLGLLGSDDPRSSDFLKIKTGETRIDPFAGLTQFATFGARVATGETVPTTGENAGEVRPLRGGERKFGQRDTGDVIFDFVRSKLSPVASLGVDAATGEEYGGAPFDVRRAAISRMIPLSVQESYEIMRQEGATKGTALTALSLLGLGVRHYDKDSFGEGGKMPNDIIKLLGGEPKTRDQK